jgi:predicted alpha/beta hydrolase
MLKTVGTSGQLTLGKKLAGRHYEMEQRADGSILLAPVTVARTATKKRRASPVAKSGGPSFHVFKVDQFELPSREERHQRREKRG